MNKNTTKGGTFDGLADMMSGGFDAEIGNADHMTKVALADIEIRDQVRDAGHMEDEENTLDDLGDALAKRQAQNIVVRPNPPGSTKPYLLVAGERRVRAGLKKGLLDLWALVAEMTDEEAEELQFAENVHRKNLTQMEEAKRIQRDLDTLGNVEAVLAKHNKSRAWLSKIMALLNLPEHAKRLVKENISADLEVINTVKTIEKADPKKAAALVEDLKKTRGKTSAREQVAKVKDEVKPSKKTVAKNAGGSVAAPRNRDIEDPSKGEVFAPAKQSRPSGRPAHEAALNNAYTAIFEQGKQPKNTLEGLSDQDREAVEAFLSTFYEAGKQATDAARTVMEGFRNGGFSSDGIGAFALVAYLHGTDEKAKFNLLNIFGVMKA